MAITYLDDNNQPSITYLDDSSSPEQNPAEKAISERPSMIDMENPITPQSFGQHPFKESLRALGGGFENAEGIPADIGLGLQNAVKTGGQSVKNIPADILKTITGKRPAQLGDIYRGAGVPEPIAATGGFLSSMSEATPVGAGGTAIASGLGKLLSPILKPIGNSLKGGLSEIMSHMSGVPKQAVTTAMDNPNVLNGGYVKNALKEAGQGMEANVKPLVNDPNAVVQATPQIKNLGSKLNLFTPNGESTKVLSTMSEPEKKLIGEWIQRADNGSGALGFNEADKIVGEIDSELQGYYKAKKMGQITKNTQFDRVAKEIRAVVNDARKSQFPQAEGAINKYSDAMKAQDANRAFSRFLPKSNLIPRAAIEAALGWAHPAAALAGGAMQSPFIQGKAIQAGSVVGSALSNPKLMGQTLKELAKRRNRT